MTNNSHSNDPTLSIGEFADGVGLSVSAVRFYSDRGLLQATEIDRSTGYRRFRQSQLADGELVADLRRMNMPLVEIALVLDLPIDQRAAAAASHIERLALQVEDARRIVERLPSSAGHEARTEIDGPLLLAGIQQVTHAAGADPLSPHHMTVLFELRSGSLRIASTDRYRLCVRDLLPSKVGRDFSVVVAAAEMERWVGTTVAMGAATTVTVDGSHMRIFSEPNELFATALPITFPDYEPILESSNTADVSNAVVSQSDLVAAIEQDASQEIRIRSAADHLVVGSSPESIHVEASVTNPSDWVTLNRSFVLEALQHSVGDSVVLEIAAPNDPVAFRSADDGTYSCMIMPILA